MAIDPNDFDEFAKRFDKLTPEERDDLLNRLERRRNTAVDDSSDTTTESLFEAMNRRGMAGSIKDATADWSTNAEYLEGLGQDAE